MPAWSWVLGMLIGKAHGFGTAASVRVAATACFWASVGLITVSMPAVSQIRPADRQMQIENACNRADGSNIEAVECLLASEKLLEKELGLAITSKISNQSAISSSDIVEFARWKNDFSREQSAWVEYANRHCLNTVE